MCSFSRKKKMRKRCFFLRIVRNAHLRQHKNNGNEQRYLSWWQSFCCCLCWNCINFPFTKEDVIFLTWKLEGGGGWFEIIILLSSSYITEIGLEVWPPKHETSGKCRKLALSFSMCNFGFSLRNKSPKKHGTRAVPLVNR